ASSSSIAEMSPSSIRMDPCGTILSGKTSAALRNISFRGDWFIAVVVYDTIRCAGQLRLLMKTAPLLFSTLLCLQLAAASSSAQSNSNCAPAQAQLKAAELAAAQNDSVTEANRYEEA